MVWREKDNAIDKYCWKSNKAKCATSMTVRSRSFFENMNHAFSILLKLIVFWSMRVPIKDQEDLLHNSIYTRYKRLFVGLEEEQRVAVTNRQIAAEALKNLCNKPLPNENNVQEVVAERRYNLRNKK